MSSRTTIGDERGFTLIEMLVAALTGVIVTGALFAILEISTRQTTRIAERTVAAAQARNTLNRMVEELHSACLGPKFLPVQPKSNETRIIFRDATGESTEPKEPIQREIYYEEASHKLLEKTTKLKGTWPLYETTGSASSAVTIGEHVEKAVVEKKVGEKTEITKLPIFSYYGYAEKAEAPGEGSVTGLEPSPLPVAGEGLTKEAAGEAAAVSIAFAVAPAKTNITKVEAKAPDRNAEVQSQIVFSFQVPSAETPLKADPCE